MSDQAFFAVKLVLVESVLGHVYATKAQALVNVEEHPAYRVVVESVDGHGVCEPKVGVEVFGFYVVEALIEERQTARKEKNYARADEIRAELTAMGILLEDTKEGVKWKRA